MSAVASAATNAPERSVPVGLCAAVIAAAGLLAYSGTFQCPFIFDDFVLIEPSSGLAPWPPFRGVMLMPSRPLIGLSYALNYAISGYGVWSYHALNLLIHVMAALALFGVVRRTLLTERLREKFRDQSTWLALAVALIWTVHPLVTQAITYTIQRCESLMGLFYLSSLYCAIRASDSGRRSRWWVAGSIVACAAGMASKEVMVTAPIMVVIYDSLFGASTIRENLRKRWPLYSGLAATWVLLVVARIAAPPTATAGFETKGVTAWAYFRSEFGVILHYLRLAVWPDGLVLDYAWPVANSIGEIVPQALAIVALAGATVFALYKRRPIGFLGAWFFLILSPTSSVMPIVDLAYEHRMYLPLAGVVCFFVLAGSAFANRLIQGIFPERQWIGVRRRAGLVILSLIVGVLTVATLRRNLDYRSDLVMWGDVVSKRPENGRGHANLALALASRDRVEEALPHFYLGCKYTPAAAKNQHNTGLALFVLGRVEEAKPFILEALRLKPNFAIAHYNLGRVLAAEGDPEEAIAEFSESLSIDPRHAESYLEMGRAQEKRGRLKEAIDSYKSALRMRGDWVEALSRLAIVLSADSEFRDLREARLSAERAVSLSNAENPDAYDALASVCAATGRLSDAVEAAQQALKLANDSGDRQMSNEIEARLRAYEEAARSAK